MSTTLAEGFLFEPWPLTCTQCGKVWARFPLIAQAMGNAPSLCTDCLLKFMKLVNDPPKNQGMTITFNSWKSPDKKSEGNEQDA